jgi:hypothetical protein
MSTINKRVTKQSFDYLPNQFQGRKALVLGTFKQPYLFGGGLFGNQSPIERR